MPPSLVALCLQVLARYPDQIHALPVRLRLRPATAAALLDDLVPDPAALDPRLWAVLTQLYAPLPHFLAACALPLFDTHLPLLQAIPPSHLFSLVTLLDLSATQHLTDQTIHTLKFLHLLTALDASGNPISAYAIKSLAATMQLNDDDDSPRRHRGPCELRILALKNCKGVNNDVYSELDKFPLLSVVDLRGTACTRYAATQFKPCTNDELYYPCSLRVSLAALQVLQPDLSASAKPYIITINKLHHPGTKPLEQGRVGQQNSFIVIPSNPANKIKVGNTHVLEKQIEAREEQIRHEKNKEAWYDRQDRLEEREYQQSNFADEQSRLKNTLRAQTVVAISTTNCENASTRLSKAPLGNRGLTPTSRSLLTSGVTPVARTPSTFTSIPSTSTATGSASISRSHPPKPHQTHLGAPAPLRSHHSSAVPVSAQRPQVYGTGGFGGQSLPRQLTALTIEVPRVTNDIGPPPVWPGPSATSDSPAFYARVAAPRRSASSSSLRVISSSADNAITSRALRDAPHAHLKLFRPPPAYAVLGEVLAHQESAKRQRDAEREDGIPRGATSALSGMAAVDMDGAKAQRMRVAMEDALKVRMRGAQGHTKGVGLPPAFIVEADRTERKRAPLSVSMSAPVFSFPDSPSTSTLGASSGSTSKIRSMSSALATLSASFKAYATGHETDAAPAARSRNPFRKRVVSHPDLPVFGANGNIEDISASTSAATPAKTAKALSNVVTSMKIISKSTTPSSPTLKRNLSFDKVNVSMKDVAPLSETNTNPKPLIPISAVKMPILTEEMRQEALRREALESASLSKKRANIEDDDEEDSDADGGFKHPPSKKRSIAKGRASTSSIASSKGKGRAKEKEKEEKTRSFDWEEWSKKDTA